MRANISGKAVMITGAGGSIGSEIVRQVFALNPSRIVLLELSEHALYQIEMELDEKLEEAQKYHAGTDREFSEPAIVNVLGSVDDEDLARKLVISHNIETIYHAAAYKHIPILESNIAAALRNNTLATATLAQVARDCGVERRLFPESVCNYPPMLFSMRRSIG
jgi:FlaA1/EpsC-like NDP-sugar epimerase